MKYRIEITTFNSGLKKYNPQVKTLERPFRRKKWLHKIISFFYTKWYYIEIWNGAGDIDIFTKPNTNYTEEKSYMIIEMYKNIQNEKLMNKIKNKTYINL